jgi:hypothetical protein
VRDGQALTLTGRSRNTEGYVLRLLKAVERENPSGALYLITDNLSSHKSSPIREWLEKHPRVESRSSFRSERAGSICKKKRVVASVQTGGISRPNLCRRRGDRESSAGWDRATQLQSETVGVGPSAEAPKASAAFVCLPSLRNGA